jgi:hypothetical protein
LRGGINTYAYVRNNPLRWADPSGLFSEALLAELAHLSHSPATALARASPYVGFATAGFFAGYTVGSQINAACGGNCFPELGPWIYDRLNPPPTVDEPRTIPPPIELEEDDEEELESCPL